jgi:peroxiredoxin
MRYILASLTLFAVVLFHSTTRTAQGQVETDEDVLAGHSFHGEAFNEGPRQAAYLMPGLGNVDFPASTTHELAQRFIHQGVAQLHGFWYYEAERSFRQAAQLDPQCAISYWGMALANVENRQRAREFIAEAVKLKDQASRREQLYIAAYDRFCRDEDEAGKKIEKKDRALNYTRDLEELVEEFPNDIEARAFLALQLWQNERADLPIVSHTAINAVLQDVFDANPMHPAHHYRIHLWDKPKPERALASAALCGPSLPAIAHMWHMPGHIYSKLHRYQDAVWQQEASARVDHAHMIRDRVLPDQIHNFAHNNEWLIRNMLKIGRVDDAMSLAQNMLSLPRHPKYNTLKKGSTKLGRERLLLTLSTYRLWPELIAMANQNLIEATDDPLLQIERNRYLGVAHALSGHTGAANQELAALEKRLSDLSAELKQLETEIEQDKQSQATAEQKVASKLPECDPRPSVPSEPTDQPKTNATQPVSTEAQPALSKQDTLKSKANRQRRSKERADKLSELKKQRDTLTKAMASVQAAQAADKQDWAAALDLWEKSDLSDNLLKAEWMLAGDKFDDALALVDKEIKKNPNEVPALAVKTWLIHSKNGTEAAQAAFEETRQLACTADLDTPLLVRLQPLALELGYPVDWAAAYEPAQDIGERPNLDSLGPFRWHPYLAPDFAVQDPKQQPVRLKQFAGKPTLVIFYLGFGCLHCVEQLHAFSPRVAEIRAAGIEPLAISTENVESLNQGLATYSKPLEIPLHADPELTAFKAYRCYDDFEQQPLHGTFLIDSDGRVLWQDISYEPFMDIDFFLQESKRLLKMQE